MTLTGPASAAFVSCDIVGHGREPDHQTQAKHIAELNECVRRSCGRAFGDGVVWASGGDGGHVAFLRPELRTMALDLILELFLWASPPGRPPRLKLRITAHFGPVSLVRGADAREQLVGSGINLCGSLLNFGTPGAVLVTEAFREFVLSDFSDGAAPAVGVRFHDDTTIYLKHFFATHVSFLSMPDRFDSQWGFPEKSDRIQLREALHAKLQWRVVYHAKRLLQVDSSDEDAMRAMELINPRQLSYRTDAASDFEAHPLLGQMNKSALRDLILAAHLIEREDGEIVCAHEDPGDAMFIVLKGQIGVVMTNTMSPGEGGRRPRVDLCYGEGKILGELALALQRRRTATLQAVGPTALLSINYSTLLHLLDGKPKNVLLERSFNEFLLGRILEHLCRNAEYLAAAEGSPLVGIESPWEQMVDGSERYTFSWNDVEVIDPTEEDFHEPGVYILTSGRLVEASQSDRVRKVLSEGDHPIVYVDCPSEIVSFRHRYRIDMDADLKSVSMVRISDRVLRSWGPRVYAKIVDAVKSHLRRQFLFDVFISYNHRDEHIARRWYEAMITAGLRVYMSQPEAMRRFKVEIELALVESLVMVPFISLQVQSQDQSESWVRREIEFRRRQFGPENGNILPIELNPGIAQQFTDGFSAVALTGDGEGAIEEVIRTVLSVRSGLKPPPFARRRAATESL